MLPEVERYMAAKGAADDELTRMHNKLSQEMPSPQHPLRPSWTADDKRHQEYAEEYGKWQVEYREWNEKYHAELRKSNAKHSEAMRKARAILLEETEDPTIKWMLTDMRKGYWSYVEQVLPILPATRDELETLANEGDWCSEFDGFLEEATNAGIVAPLDAMYDATEIAEYIAAEYGGYARTHRMEIQRMVTKIVKKALAEQAAPLRQAA